jgi:ornithine--oxo-acid transaminase
MEQKMDDTSSQELIDQEAKYVSPNYTPIPAVLTKAEGAWVWDVDGNKYLDCLSAYSAVNQGHLHPDIVKAAQDQLNLLTLTSRAFFNDQLGSFMKKLCDYSGMQMGCPMNTGAEAVETGIKVARRWGYWKKKVEADKAEIIVCENNFHGRTTTGFGPYPKGFVKIPFGDVDALRKAITPNTVGFLVEPIQGEAGVIIPPIGYLKEVSSICKENNVLLIADEIQTGFARTGKNFCYEYDDIKPDILLVGKALGGGILPVSATLGSREVMNVLTSGSHGSTFGGNPLACVIGEKAIDVIVDEKLAERSAELGEYFKEKLETLPKTIIKEVRGKGLLLAIEFTEQGGKAKKYVMEMKKRGVLAKQTHETIIRFAPPLVIDKEQIDFAFDVIQTSINEVSQI